ncbi:MAG: transglutaminase-like domain-containing protein [Dysgonamonadaceae bacterium]|jgi:transglutaminase-like putative cysteine protease|nr:transglutaminase-like domain-containing protein [Dysgonamonadaceae bacterium]
MMKKIVFVSIIALCAVSCTTDHFLNSKSYRGKVIAQFEKRRVDAASRSEELFSVFDRPDLSLRQREALQFLYAYMPLCDLADYSGDFFLSQVDGAFRARDFFHWGKTIPEDIFRHFVLVYRINNEYLDTARIAFFEELKDRIKDLSMYDAALEVNHWCHEKVTYRGTDARTSAPLALVKTSWGRCGEESTFTATALRAVGIPARQCYTPRWVHTDDNHAWVEVWIDGVWHYLGACEPEAELDAAWFTGPAKRAMMVHTNVFGLYEGPEEKNVEKSLYSVINLTGNYTETRKINVLVLDENNKPVPDARIQFMVYNYAEFYPISTNTSDANGRTSITSGMGDLMIYADKDEVYGYAKSTPTDTLTVVTLNRRQGAIYDESLVMNVPPEQQVEAVAPEKAAANAVRLAYEDSIRNAYMATFISENDALKFASELNLDKSLIWRYLQLSQGNWSEIAKFIEENRENVLLFPFLATLRDKDLRDTPSDYLTQHLKSADNMSIAPDISEDMLVRYILSPRIENELILPWRDSFKFQSNISQIIDFVRDSLNINEEENYYNCRISPSGVYNLKIADRRSRNVFFVAAARNLGIPARLEPATGKPQYYETGKWIDAVFEPETVSTANLPKGKLTVANSPTNPTKPGYETHYSIAQFVGGTFQTLQLWGNPSIRNFPYSIDLDEGYYRLMVGSRANDGSVFVNTQYFEIREGNPISVEIKLPVPDNKLFVKGIVDMNTVVGEDKTTLKELSKGKGLLICFLDLSKEPSKHILQDIPAVRQSFEEWGGGALFFVPEGKPADNTSFEGLPKQSVFVNDTDNKLLDAVTSALQLELKDNFPLIVYLSRNGGILYSSVGYKIGIGDEILKTIAKE